MELDGIKVVAIIRDSARALHDGETVGRGAIVGLARFADERNPAWLAEVLSHTGEDVLCVLKCRMGEAESAVWYGPPLAASMTEHYRVGDTRPANYDVYGVLHSDSQTPPMSVSARYIRAARISLFVPPPYRREHCYFGEAMANAR